MSDHDLYALLGVPPAAGPREIRAAYRTLARRHHPDAGGDARQMATLNAAWHVLGDPRRRAAYDARHRLARPAAHPVAGSHPARGRPVKGSTVLDFGRHAGSSIESLARSDPDYLEWLARMPIGRPIRGEIEAALRTAQPAPTARPDAARRRRGFR